MCFRLKQIKSSKGKVTRMLMKSSHMSVPGMSMQVCTTLSVPQGSWRSLRPQLKIALGKKVEKTFSGEIQRGEYMWGCVITSEGSKKSAYHLKDVKRKTSSAGWCPVAQPGKKG